jgi:hypothetical protein
MREFLAAPAPCGALELVQTNARRRYTQVALRPLVEIPFHVTSAGVGVATALWGTPPQEVIHFAFQFTESMTYHVLVNPNNPLIRAVLSAIWDKPDCVFLAISSDGEVRGLRVEAESETWQELAANKIGLLQSTTTLGQYERIVAEFTRRHVPPAQLLDWVFPSYLDLSENAWELKSQAH